MRNKRPPIFILGMHRSGTSCLTGSLQASGLYLGKASETNKNNRKGDRENKEIWRLNERVLNLNGGAWHSPVESCVWNDEALEEAKKIISSYEKHSIWGVKDPRMLFTLDGWLSVLDEVSYVGTFRNPKSVVKSLMKRNSDIGGEEYWLDLWVKYNKALLKHHARGPFPIIDFDLSDTEYTSCLKRLVVRLGLGKNAGLKGYLVNSLRRVVSQKNTEDFFDPALRSNVDCTQSDTPDDALKIYRKLKSISFKG